MLNISHILCPTDLSPEANEALRYAVALARAYEAKLSVLTWAEDLAPAQTLTRLEMSASLKQSVARALGTYVRVDNPHELDWQFVLAEGHDAAAAITRAASERGVNLVVMRSRRRPVAAALLGSTAEVVSRTALCPVLITHPQEREWINQATGEVKLRRVLVAHDFSEYAALALNYGLSLAQEYQAELHLLHVALPRRDEGPKIAQPHTVSEGAYRQALQHAVPAEAELWCEVQTAVRCGQPHPQVLAYAEEHEIDLICMGAHGSGYVRRQPLLGSTVDRVLRHAPCSVLVARPNWESYLAERDRL